MAATTEEVPRPYGRGTSSVVSFVVAMNRVDVVELVVDLDVDLVDVDLAVSLCDGPRSVLCSFGLVAPTFCCVVFLNHARGRETIKLPAVKTELLCIVFTLGLGPKLVKLNLCVVFFELVWGQPRSVLTAAL